MPRVWHGMPGKGNATPHSVCPTTPLSGFPLHPHSFPYNTSTTSSRDLIAGPGIALTRKQFYQNSHLRIYAFLTLYEMPRSSRGMTEKGVYNGEGAARRKRGCMTEKGTYVY